VSEPLGRRASAEGATGLPAPSQDERRRPLTTLPMTGATRLEVALVELCPGRRIVELAVHVRDSAGRWSRHSQRYVTLRPHEWHDVIAALELALRVCDPTPTEEEAA